MIVSTSTPSPTRWLTTSPRIVVVATTTGWSPPPSSPVPQAAIDITRRDTARRRGRRVGSNETRMALVCRLGRTVPIRKPTPAVTAEDLVLAYRDDPPLHRSS